MQLRWIALIALWTMLSGPVFAPSGATPGRSQPRPAPAKAAPKSPASRR